MLVNIFTLEAYLYQAQRGIARQRAMQETAVKYRRRESRSHNFHEKESSKDSAYGYSGGENSRLATREPTPDAWQIKQQGRRQSAGAGHPSICSVPRNVSIIDSPCSFVTILKAVAGPEEEEASLAFPL